MIQSTDSAVSGATSVIDCDVHNVVPSVEAIRPYLDEHWREFMDEAGFFGSEAVTDSYPPNAPTSALQEAVGSSGEPAGSKLELLRDQVLNTDNVELAILNCYYGVESLRNPDFAAAIASAVNDWQVAEWLEKDERLRASLVIVPHDMQSAVREIDRLGGHPGFTQVFLPARSYQPYGNRGYYPLYESAVSRDLAIGIHFGGMPGNPPTPSGWPTYYVEEYVGMTQIFQSQVTSLIVEGVFEKFPDLRVALVESGFTWLPSLMWRLDKEWKGIRREAPWMKQLPSTYIREHMRATLQPLDSPPDMDQLLEVFHQIGSEEFLMYASDYPHDRSEQERDSFLKELSAESRQKIMADNARNFYRL